MVKDGIKEETPPADKGGESMGRAGRSRKETSGVVHVHVHTRDGREAPRRPDSRKTEARREGG